MELLVLYHHIIIFLLLASGSSPVLASCLPVCAADARISALPWSVSRVSLFFFHYHCAINFACVFFFFFLNFSAPPINTTISRSTTQCVGLPRVVPPREKKNPCFCQFHSLFLVAAGWLSLTGGGGGGPFRRLACFCCRSVASRLTRIRAMRCLPNIDDDLLPTWTSSSRTPSRTSCGMCFLNLELKLETSSRIH